jgi:hypothetical protein
MAAEAARAYLREGDHPGRAYRLAAPGTKQAGDEASSNGGTTPVRLSMKHLAQLDFCLIQNLAPLG